MLGSPLAVAAGVVAVAVGNHRCPDDCDKIGTRRNSFFSQVDIVQKNQTPSGSSGIGAALDLLDIAPPAGYTKGLCSDGKTLMNLVKQFAPGPLPVLPSLPTGPSRGIAIAQTRTLNKQLEQQSPTIWIKVTDEECDTRRCGFLWLSKHQTWIAKESDWIKVKESAAGLTDLDGGWPPVREWDNPVYARDMLNAMLKRAADHCAGK